MEFVLEIYRDIKSILFDISSIVIFGYYIDTILHFIISFVLTLLFMKIYSIKKSVFIVSSIVVLKEIVDLFAKSRWEYVRPPTLDVFYDLLFSFLGIGFALLFYFLKRKITAIS
jgi:hypothetical protein